MELDVFIIEAYGVFCKRIHNMPSFVFKPSERERRQISNFIDLVSNKYGRFSIGKTFLFNFMSFNYEYYSSLDHCATKKIPLNWVIGRKALSRWVNRTEDDLYHAMKYASDNGVHMGLIRSAKNDHVNDVASVRISEEAEKKRFHNEPEGLSNCIETTTLYNRRSVSCISCRYRIECKKLLKDNYPKIYIARGYLKR